MFTDVAIGDPGFERVAAYWQMLESVTTLCVGLDEEWCVQNEDGAAHPIMNVAMHGHGSGFIEHDRARFFVFSITAEVEPFRFRIREDVVIHVIQVGELDRRAPQNSSP